MGDYCMWQRIIAWFYPRAGLLIRVQGAGTRYQITVWGTSFPKKQYPKRTQISEYFCNQIMNEFHIVRPISRYGAPSLVHMHMIYIAYCATVAFA